MNNLFMEKGTRDFGYNEIAESLLQNRLNNGTEETFYKGMEQRLRDIPRYTEDDVNKGMELLHKHLENGMDILFKVDDINGDNQGVIVSQIPIETIYEMKLFDEMNIMPNGDYRDFESYFIANLKPDRNDNIELSEITIVDSVGIDRTVKFENNVILGYKNLKVCGNDYDGLEVTYAKNTDKEITDICKVDVIGRIFERQDVVENIDFVNNSLAKYDFTIEGTYKNDNNFINISNLPDKININIKENDTQKVYNVLEKTLTEINFTENMNEYEIASKIIKDCKQEKIDFDYENNMYEKTKNNQDIEL